MSQTHPPHHSGRPRARVPGRTLATVGLVFLILGIVGVVISGISLTISAIALERTVSSVADAPDIDQTTPASLEANTPYTVFVPDDAGLTCQAHAPDGEDIVLDERGSQNVSANDESWSSVGSFTTTAAGDYTLECGQYSQPELVPVAGKIVEGDDGFGQMFGATFGLSLGIIGVAFSFVPLVVGLVLFLVGRHQRKAASAGVPPQGPGQPGPPWHGPPQPGAPFGPTPPRP